MSAVVAVGSTLTASKPGTFADEPAQPASSAAPNVMTARIAEALRFVVLDMGNLPRSWVAWVDRHVVNVPVRHGTRESAVRRPRPVTS